MNWESFLEWEHIFPNSLEKIWCWIQFFKENWHAYEKTIYPIKLVFLSYTNQNRLFQYFLEWQFANAKFARYNDSLIAKEVEIKALYTVHLGGLPKQH